MTSYGIDGTVEFLFYRPHAAAVQLAGDFSSWSASAISMRNSGDGWWSVSLNLKPGEYRFRYIADGHWFTDFASHGIEACPFGFNSVLVVPVKQVSLSLNQKKIKASEILASPKTKAKAAA